MIIMVALPEAEVGQEAGVGQGLPNWCEIVQKVVLICGILFYYANYMVCQVFVPSLLCGILNYSRCCKNNWAALALPQPLALPQH